MTDISPVPKGGLKRTKRIVSLVVDFDDGQREILEFQSDNLAFYRQTAAHRKTPRDDGYDRHEIWWVEKTQ